MEKTQNRLTIEDEDTELIKAINSGDQALFYDLVKKYETKLYNFGLRMCHETRDAEEMVQDTFLTVYRFLADFRFESKFKNWLYTIAGSACLKKKRKSKISREKEISLEEVMPGEDDPSANSTPPWVSEPLENLLNDELSNVIQEAILTLPEKYRRIVVLRDLEGFSTEETAQLLTLKPVTVKVRLHRARLFLKERLKAYFETNR